MQKDQWSLVTFQRSNSNALTHQSGKSGERIREKEKRREKGRDREKREIGLSSWLLVDLS